LSLNWGSTTIADGLGPGPSPSIQASQKKLGSPSDVLDGLPRIRPVRPSPWTDWVQLLDSLVGGVAQKITNGITTPTYTPEALLFHPTSPDKIVLLSTHKITSIAQKHVFTLGLHALEYKYGSPQDTLPQDTLSQGTCSQDTCSFDMPFTSDPYDEQVQFDIRLVNNNGLYSICWFYEEIVDLSDIDIQA
jgi:hypothetical protein